MSYLAYIKLFPRKAKIVALILHIGCLVLLRSVATKYIPNPSQLRWVFYWSQGAPARRKCE